MEISTEWNLICRICLQDGEMRSIFDKDDNDFLISDKIMFCSNISISKGVNLPEHICLKCLDDLHTAYIFRSKCENSNTVLQSFVKQNAANDYITYSTNGEVYEYKPPEGLNVKRIRNKKTSENTSQIVELEEFQDEEELFEEEERIDSEYDEIDEKYENPEDAIEYSKTRNNSQSEPDKNSVIKKFPAQVKLRIKGENISNNEEYEVIQSDNVFSIKPINNEDYKSIRKSKVKVVSGETITKEDGSTEIRICKNIRSNTPKPLKFCDICGNTYKHKHALDAHMRRHRNEKPFKCEVCGRGFVLNVELNCHMRTHTGQKPYACRYCGRRFSDFGSRIKHERSHTGERPYPCETCGKAFAYSYGLSSHMLTHTGEKNFSCEKCGKSFSKKHHLKNHLNTHAKRESRILGNNNFELQEIKEENTIMPVENFESEQFTENKTNYEEMNDNSEYLLAVLDSDNNSYIEEINIVEIKQEQYDVNDTIIVESR